MNKKKIIIAAVSVVAIIAIAIIVSLLTKDTKTAYTISFNTDGGNKVSSQKVEEGEKVTKPVDPTKEGYEFLGWYLNGNYFDFKTEVKENLTLDAKWKEIVKDEETDINDEENKDDEVVEDNKDDEKEEEEATTKVTKYTVTFDSNGGSKVSSQSIEKNKTAKQPTNPTKDGYKFLGWYLGSTKYDFSKKVTKNITLKAKWDKVEEQKPEEEKPNTQPEVVKEYTVTFNTEGGSTVKAQTVKENETATKPSNPTLDGYTFEGWYLNGVMFDFSTKITRDTTLTAKWRAVEPEPVKTYTVTFNTDGGSAVKAQTVKENDTVTKPSNPTRKWDIFKGWYLDGKEFDFNTKITKNITLTAKWDKVDIKEIDVEGSVANQVRIYITLNDKNVAGTVKIESVSGKVATVKVPATGVVKTKGTYVELTNPVVEQ